MKSWTATRRLCTILTAAIVSLVAAQSSNAAIVINLTESAGNVYAVLDGSANLSALSFENGWGDPALTGDYLSGSWVWVGSGTGDFEEFSGPTLSGPATFGTASATLAIADTSTGPQAGVIAQATSGIGLPIGYVSGTSIHSTSTWFGQTIADMGLVPGSYTWTWGQTHTDADSLTLNILPEPTTALTLTLIGLVSLGRRR